MRTDKFGELKLDEVCRISRLMGRNIPVGNCIITPNGIVGVTKGKNRWI